MRITLLDRHSDFVLDMMQEWIEGSLDIYKVSLLYVGCHLL